MSSTLNSPRKRTAVSTCSPHREVQRRLFCLPYAGGTAALYRGWPAALGRAIRVHPVQLSGRAERISQAPHDTLRGVVDSLCAAIAPFTGDDYALFGHSMGAMLWFEVIRQLRRAGAPLPAHLFVSACRAPHLRARHGPIHQLPQAHLVDALRHYGGTPAAVLRNAELMSLVLPYLRADLRLIETRQHSVEIPLDIPITAIGGRDDDIVSREEIIAWRHHCGAAFRYFELPGTHFFIHDQTSTLTELVATQLHDTRGGHEGDPTNSYLDRASQ